MSSVRNYSLFMLSMPASQNRKYYIIGTYVYYILMVYHVNAIHVSTSCSRIICSHCLLLLYLRFTAYCGPTLSVHYCYLFHYWYAP